MEGDKGDSARSWAPEHWLPGEGKLAARGYRRKRGGWEGASCSVRGFSVRKVRLRKRGEASSSTVWNNFCRFRVRTQARYAPPWANAISFCTKKQEEVNTFPSIDFY